MKGLAERKLRQINDLFSYILVKSILNAQKVSSLYLLLCICVAYKNNINVIYQTFFYCTQV